MSTTSEEPSGEGQAAAPTGSNPAGRWPLLDPGLPVAESTRTLLAGLLERVVETEPGVREADDAEALHDFRVAVRRTRSALGQLRDVLPAAAVEPLRRELSWLGRLTGPVRDLDVFLEGLEGHRAAHPGGAGSVGPVLQALERRRAAAGKRLAAALRSTRYRALLEEWRKLASPGEAGPAGGRATGEAGAAAVRRAERRAAELAAGLDAGSPAAELHRLRIRCKKLRYLLEFFGGVLAGRDASDRIDRLKRLQDSLGALNDLDVQRRLLEVEQAAGVETGGLVDTLAERERSERQRLGAALAAVAGFDRGS